MKNIRLKYVLKTSKKGITVQQIALAGLMLALITLFKLSDKLMPKTPLGTSWVEFYMIFASILVLIMPFGISLLVLISAPLLWLALGQTWQTSPFSFFLDYSLPLLSILIVYLARFIKETDGNKVFTWRKFAIFFLTIIAFVIKWFFHTVSGVVSYDTIWAASASLNAPASFATMGAAIGVVIIMIPKISFMQQFINSNGYSW